ncbi:MAG TPA: dihydrodipicolinate synthase family protein [Terriglobia bacterium]
MSLDLDDYIRRRRTGRSIQGISAALLPYDAAGRIDERAFRRHLGRTLAAGLRVAVNMDTGYVDLLTPAEKGLVLQWTAEASDREWFAGALPSDQAGPLHLAYARECTRIAEVGGVPVIFPSAGTAALTEDGLSSFFHEIGAATHAFLAFELGAMFSAHGRMFSERVLTTLMEMPQCCGLKHSSLDRATELERLKLRDRVRPDFPIFSGNDLVSDMVEYGSDYLLGVSTFAPELFAARDRAWAEGAPSYLELRDVIQYLGWIGFREPVPAYKHSAALYLKLTGGLECDDPHPRAARRDDWDRELLADVARRVKTVMSAQDL